MDAQSSGRALLSYSHWRQAAAKAGIKAAFAVPIIYNHHVDGVLMFHAREAKEEDDRLIQVLFSHRNSSWASRSTTSAPRK